MKVGEYGGEILNLRNNQITIGELLRNDDSRKILQREFPELINNRMIRMASNMSLRRVLQYTRGQVPQSKIDEILEELRRL